MKPISIFVAMCLSAAAGALIVGYDGRHLSALAPVEVHYAPAENLEAIDAALIGEAREAIDMAAYVLTDSAVLLALHEAALRGVRIRLYRQPDEHPPSVAIETMLETLTASPNVTQRFKPAGGDPMHLKSYCVDGRTLRGGAANFSASGLKRQENDLVVLRGPGACAGFEATFEKAWENTR